MELPGGAGLRAKVGVHSGEASDSLVGCSSTLHYRWAGSNIRPPRPILLKACSACWCCPSDVLMAEAKGQGHWIWMLYEKVTRNMLLEQVVWTGV